MMLLGLVFSCYSDEGASVVVDESISMVDLQYQKYREE